MSIKIQKTKNFDKNRKVLFLIIKYLLIKIKIMSMVLIL